jgi:hypothetical protein
LQVFVESTFPPIQWFAECFSLHTIQAKTSVCIALVFEERNNVCVARTGVRCIDRCTFAGIPSAKTLRWRR